MVPSLKVLKKISNKPERFRSDRLPTSSSDASYSVNSSVDTESFQDENDPINSTYKVDFKNRGVDVCMAKAYSVIASKAIDSNNYQKLNQSIA